MLDSPLKGSNVQLNSVYSLKNTASAHFKIQLKKELMYDIVSITHLAEARTTEVWLVQMREIFP